MVWFILIFGGMFLIAIDRAFGLAFLVAGYGVIALITGIAGVLGVNLANYAVVLNLLLISVFVPICFRLALILHTPSETADKQTGTTSPGIFTDRNARQTLRGILVARGLLTTFTTHFVTGGMALISLAMLAHWVAPDPLILLAGSIAGAHLGGVVAQARGVTDPRKKINWSVAGLAVGTLVAAGVFLLSLHWLATVMMRGEAVPWQ